MEINKAINRIKNKMDSIGGLKNVYFVGCGGSRAAMFSAFYLLKSEAKNIGTNIFNSNEFVHMTPKALDERSICIICSLKATPETVEAVRKAKGHGATAVALTGNMDTGMAEVGEYVFTYTRKSDGNQATALKLAFEILKQFENYKYYEEARDAFSKIDGIIDAAVEKSLPAAKEFAKEFKDDGVFQLIGSGCIYGGAAYTMANCHLMEMQWKNAVLTHSGEYFHGPFETTDEQLPIILFKSVGKTRPLDERVERFIEKYAKRITKIDARELGLNQLDSNVAEYFSSVMLLTVAWAYMEELSKETKHPLETRRYMWQFEY